MPDFTRELALIFSSDTRRAGGDVERLSARLTQAERASRGAQQGLTGLSAKSNQTATALTAAQKAVLRKEAALQRLEAKAETGARKQERLRQAFQLTRLAAGATTDELERAGRAFDRLADRAERSAQRQQRAASQRSRFGGAVGGARAASGLVGAALGAAATVTGVNFAAQGVREAARVEQLSKVIQDLEVRSGRAANSLARAAGQVQSLGFTSRQSLEFVVGLTDAGVSLETQIGLASGALRAASVSGRTLDETLGRLSEGIAKQERELLDEFRIFVRLDDATKAYAQSLGLASDKTLTAQQRTEAFARAVNQELAQKGAGSINSLNDQFTQLGQGVERLRTSFGGLFVGPTNEINRFLIPALEKAAQFINTVRIGATAIRAVGGPRLFGQFGFPDPQPEKPFVGPPVPAGFGQPPPPAGRPRRPERFEFFQFERDELALRRALIQAQFPPDARSNSLRFDPARNRLLGAGRAPGVPAPTDAFGVPLERRLPSGVRDAFGGGLLSQAERVHEERLRLEEQFAREQRRLSEQSFDIIKRQAEGLFDAMLQGGRGFWNFFKLSGLTAIKDVFSDFTARSLFTAFGGRSPGNALGSLFGLGGFGALSRPGAPGGTGGFAGPVTSLGSLGIGGGLFSGIGSAATGGFAGGPGAAGILGGLGGGGLQNLQRLLLTGRGSSTTIGLDALGVKGGFFGTNLSGLIGGGLLVDGLRRGGAAGLGEAAAGGALVGFRFGGPVGAAIGGAAGGLAGLFRLNAKGATEKVREKIKSAYGIEIRDKGVLGQIADVAKDQAGGNIAAAIGLPGVRDLVIAYGMATGQRGAGALGGIGSSTFSVVQRGGQLFQDPSFRNGQAFVFQSNSIPTVALGRSTPVNQIVMVDPSETQNLWEHGVARGITRNSRLVQDAAIQANRTNFGRAQQRALMLEPYAI